MWSLRLILKLLDLVEEALLTGFSEPWLLRKNVLGLRGVVSTAGCRQFVLKALFFQCIVLYSGEGGRCVVQGAELRVAGKDPQTAGREVTLSIIRKIAPVLSLGRLRSGPHLNRNICIHCTLFLIKQFY